MEIGVNLAGVVAVALVVVLLLALFLILPVSLDRHRVIRQCLDLCEELPTNQMFMDGYYLNECVRTCRDMN